MPGRVTGAALGGVAIAVLFEQARRAAREARMGDFRAMTMSSAADTKRMTERAAQEESMARMRATTRAQLSSTLAQKGVSPALLMSTGAGGGADPATATFVSQAAAHQEPGAWREDLDLYR